MMKSASFGLMLAVCSLSIVSCNKSSTIATNQSRSSSSATPAAAPTVDQFAAARANFQKYCTPCHGDNAEGGLVKIDNKRLKVPTLRSGHALMHSDEAFAKQITAGGDGMPAFKDKLKPDEISDLARFIRHQFQGDRPAEMKH